MGIFKRSTSEDAERATDAAADAVERWADTSGPERGSILETTSRVLDDSATGIVELLTREVGVRPRRGRRLSVGSEQWAPYSYPSDPAPDTF